MKKAIPLLASYYLGLSVFAGVIVLAYANFQSSLDGKVTLVFLILGSAAWLVLFAVGNVLNCVALATRAKNGKIGEISTSIRLLKFGSIPFFILNFALSGAFFLIFFFATRGIGFIVLPIPVFITWIILLSSSVNTLTLLAILYRRKAVSRPFLIVNAILQLTFVVDIVSAFFILRKAKHAPDPAQP